MRVCNAGLVNRMVGMTPVFKEDDEHVDPTVGLRLQEILAYINEYWLRSAMHHNIRCCRVCISRKNDFIARTDAEPTEHQFQAGRGRIQTEHSRHFAISGQLLLKTFRAGAGCYPA